MKVQFQKVKTVHHILSDFFSFLRIVEKNPKIHRIIPWRISRQQKGSSLLRFMVSYAMKTGIKGIMAKGSTAQEVFFLCKSEDQEEVVEFLLSIWKNSLLPEK